MHIDHRMRAFKGHLGIANPTSIPNGGPPLKLYLLTQQVVAGDEDTARHIHPFRDSEWDDDCMWGLSS